MRTYVVTGAGSGIGKATTELLRERGGRVIGVDLHGAEITADLATAEGAQHMVEEVTAALAGAPLDGVIACAGLAVPKALLVEINYYGAVRTMEGLRPLQLASAAPRTVVVASMASIMPSDPELVALLTDGTETDAMARAEVLEKNGDTANLLYSSSKLALVRWIRRQAPTADWAGAGIPLNAIAPGIIDTPMVADLLATEESKASILQMVPMPLGGVMPARAVAYLLAWLVSEENGHLCGQTVFIDGGSDVVLRGDGSF